jgi:hypothetical protein
MKRRLRIGVGVVLAALAIHACKKDRPAETPIDLGYNYLPGEVGSYIIYAVDSIAHDDVIHAVPDTIRYQLKEIVKEAFTDASGKPALRIERYTKMYNDSIPYSALPWIGPRIWYASKSSSDYQKVEENNRFIRLVFPVREGKEWNGNSYNALGEKIYEITDVDQAEAVNGISFDSVATVLQFEQKNFIENRYEVEKYARNVGLIYKQADSYYHGGGLDTVGYEYRQKIVSYGK